MVTEKVREIRAPANPRTPETVEAFVEANNPRANRRVGGLVRVPEETQKQSS